MGIFDFIFGDEGPGQNPSDAASRYFEQIPGMVKPYYDPYIEQGRQASGIANPIYQRMAEDPSQFLDALMRNYSPSEGFKFKEKNLIRNAQNTAAQGGYAGTPYAQMEQSEMVNGLLSGDMQQFLSNLMGVQGRGLEGQERRVGRGYDASSALSDALAGNMAQRGNLAYQGQAQMNQNALDRSTRNANFLGDIFKVGGNLGGSLAGAGGWF